MLHITRAIIVEGAYDRQRVNEVCDAFCFVTEGFNVFKNREKQEFIRLLAERTGIIVLTDSDRAGFLIRSRIKSIARGGDVVNAYIPEIFGKERRKDKPSAEGKLGVEGMEREALERALAPFAAKGEINADPVTKADFFDLGLTGLPDSAARRKELCQRLKIPVHLSSNALLEAINAIMTKKQLYETANSIKL